MDSLVIATGAVCLGSVVLLSIAVCFSALGLDKKISRLRKRTNRFEHNFSDLNLRKLRDLSDSVHSDLGFVEKHEHELIVLKGRMDVQDDKIKIMDEMLTSLVEMAGLGFKDRK